MYVGGQICGRWKIEDGDVGFYVSIRRMRGRGKR